MSPAHVLEPTYDGLRRRLIAGSWPAGARLEAARLAQDLGVSITPVRDSLNRLTGERLVHASAGDGFHVPLLDAAELSQLINWHQILLGTALHVLISGGGAIALPQGHNGIADHSAVLFAAIATAAANPELDWAVGNAAARLGPFRRLEEKVLSEVGLELQRIEACARSGSWEALAHLVQTYHDRRLALTSDLAHAVRER
ncbi:MAG: GntR family transcriptional regulator [Pseudomonadota bacterium]